MKNGGPEGERQEKAFGGFPIEYKSAGARFVLAFLLSAAAYLAADFWTLSAWNSDESAVIEVVDIGERRAPSPESEGREREGDFPFRTLETELAVRVLTGDRKGRVFPLVVTQMEGGGVELKRGLRYILFADVFEDGSAQYSIADAFRAPAVIGFAAFACACLAVFAGRAGVRALLGLGLSVALLLWGYIPLAARGVSPVPLAFLAAVLISGITVFCAVRRGRARAVAFLGALGGVSGAFLAGLAMVSLWRLSGLAGESASLLATTLPGIDLRGILLASVVIGALGAVLDVGVSITSAMSELAGHDLEIAPLELWRSGLRVGSDVLGSMINTLVLAYLGSSLPMAILISSAGADFWGLVNDPYVGEEIVHSIAGTSGLLLTIPITATLFVLREKISAFRAEAAKR